jgi:hypothetical protein
MDISNDYKILSTERMKILNFYNKNKNLNFEDINELIIDLFENIISNISGQMTNSITKDLIIMLKEQTHQISDLKKDVDSMKNNIIMKLYDIKNEYIENIKLLINNNDNNNIIKIIKKIEDENIKLIEEIIPKNDIKYYEHYNNLMIIFKEEIKNLNNFDNIELKYNDLLKNIEVSLINNINNSELINKINDINQIKQHEMLNLNNNITNSELRIQNFISNKNNDIKDIVSSLINYITKSEEHITNNIKNLDNSKNDSLIKYITSTDEQIKNNIIEIKTNNEIQHKTNLEIVQKLNEHLDKYNNSSKKGNISENYIENLLNNIYKTADIKRTTDKSKSGDFIMNYNNIDILFEIKNYNINIPSHEVIKFERDINHSNMCGIMISISSGICNKYNYQIDINNNSNILLYIHDLHYDADKIKVGVDIINNLHSKIKLNINNNDHCISNEMLNNINNEYQKFIDKRNKMITHIKDSSKISIQLIEEMNISNLDNLLSTKFAFNNSINLECDICKKFVASNTKTLTTHKNKCIALRDNTENVEDNKKYIKRRNDILYKLNNKKLTVKNETLEKYKIIFKNEMYI